METLDPILYMIIGGCVGGLLGWFLARDQVQKYLEDLRDKTEERARKRAQRQVREEMVSEIRHELIDEYTEEAQQEADKMVEKILDEARDEAETSLKNAKIEARDLLSEARSEAEDELKTRRRELQKVEERLGVRESKLDERGHRLDQREGEIQEQFNTLDDRDKVLSDKIQEVQRTLEKCADLSVEEAVRELKDSLVTRAEMEAREQIRAIEEETEVNAAKKARQIISIACQRFAADYVADKCVNVLELPSDKMKGRIIGREGRNIRALEAATGVDVIIDDTPEVVVVSCFDPVRREIARRSLEKLIADGRIHPARIEEVVDKSDQEMTQVIKDAGEEAALELGIHGLHSELLNLVGRLKFRTSYGQNMWSHSIEVGFLCGLMASELELNVAHARRAGLLHDIGKALTHERQGSHALVGAELAERYGEVEVVRNAIAAHHNEEPQNSVIAHLVIAADALSGARPGARREILGTYVKRLKELERISADFEGVKESYAIQAGREIRVMVEHGAVDDDGARALSKEIARRIEDELTYPGQVKVTVIRETRATGYAR